MFQINGECTYLLFVNFFYFCIYFQSIISSVVFVSSGNCNFLNDQFILRWLLNRSGELRYLCGERAWLDCGLLSFTMLQEQRSFADLTGHYLKGVFLRSHDNDVS